MKKELDVDVLETKIERKGYFRYLKDLYPTVTSFNEYLAETGYLTYSKTKKILDPYLRIKIFSSAKFNQKKYEEAKIYNQKALSIFKKMESMFVWDNQL